MTESSTQSPPSVDQPLGVPPGNLLLKLIVAVLAPMFLAVAGGNAEHARVAAAETINDYRARNTDADLIAVAQIIAFGLAALASLSQSMAETLPIVTALRLRGNANGLNRSANQIRNALGQDCAAAPLPDLEYEAAIAANVADTQMRLAAAQAAAHVVTEAQTPAAQTPFAAASNPSSTNTSPAPQNLSAAAITPHTASTVSPAAATGAPAAVTVVPASVAPASEPTTKPPVSGAAPAVSWQPAPAAIPPTLAAAAPMPPLGPTAPLGHPPQSERQRQMLWAVAMSDVAQEFTDSLPNLPQSERWAVSRKAAALSSCANHLIAGIDVPTFPEFRAGLHPAPKQGGKHPR